MKELKKIIRRLYFVFVLETVLALVGCKSTETIPEISNAEPEIKSEEISEAILENVSEEEVVLVEEVSEETSEEEFDPADYTVDAINAFINDICTNYQYEKEEQIRSAVIAMNIDYIAEEDLEVLMNGKTPKEMEDILEGYLKEYLNIVSLFKAAQESFDAAERVTDETNLDNRFRLYDLYINQEIAKRTLMSIEEDGLINGEKDSIYFYIWPEKVSYDEIIGNYTGENFTDNNSKFINYYLLNQEILFFDSVSHLEANCDLPYSSMDTNN